MARVAKTDHSWRMEQPVSTPTLSRVLTLPLLVFYGVGVTVGAGIFALIGEILLVSGDLAPAAFLLAGVIAGMTGLSYALLVAIFPKAGGEAVFVNRGLGHILGWFAGTGVAITGIISSAAIARAFAGYAGSIVPMPHSVLILMVILLLAGVAAWGIRESVWFAAIITVLEVSTLLVVIAFGLPLLDNLPPISQMLPHSIDATKPVLAGAVLAFLAFIGFEDIENMAEETLDPARTAPRAIFWTLGVTVFLYLALALVAISSPIRDAISHSSAPMALLFGSTTGLDARPVIAIAAIAMINGILVQIVMAARVIYGMANEGLLPAWFGTVSQKRRTPLRATITVALAIVILALAVPLVQLAEATSVVTLSVFALVNLSLFTLGGNNAHPGLARWRWVGLLGAAVCLLVLAFQASTWL
ncbi:MAG: amino acid permease [Nitratireductor sp.]|nr:amino acid permease [Nitratireductor sp.]